MDLLELYSFNINLNIYTLLYLYTHNKSLIEFLFIQFIGNIFFYYTFNNHIFQFLNHNYWKKNLKTIAAPQLIQTVSNIITYNNDYKIIYIIPINLLIQYFINNIFKNEISESKNLRYINIFLFFFLRIIF